MIRKYDHATVFSWHRYINFYDFFLVSPEKIA